MSVDLAKKRKPEGKRNWQVSRVTNSGMIVSAKDGKLHRIPFMYAIVFVSTPQSFPSSEECASSFLFYSRSGLTSYSSRSHSELARTEQVEGRVVLVLHL